MNTRPPLKEVAALSIAAWIAALSSVAPSPRTPNSGADEMNGVRIVGPRREHRLPGGRRRERQENDQQARGDSTDGL